MTRLCFEQADGGALKLWERPIHGFEYVIGVDVAEEKLKEGYQRGRVTVQKLSRRDFTAGYVLERESARIVAAIHGSMNTPDAALMCYSTAMWFNEALLAIEVSGAGRGIQDIIANEWHYPRCFVQPAFHKIAVFGNQVSEFGWKTTTITRPLIISAVQQYLQDSDQTIPDKGLLDELGTMEYDRMGKPQASGRKKDDRVFAFGIALMARRYLLQSEGPEPEEQKYQHLPSFDQTAWKKVDELAAASTEAEREYDGDY